jgi:hypothetical protein
VVCRLCAVVCRLCAVVCHDYAVVCRLCAVVCHDYAVVCRCYVVVCRCYAVVCRMSEYIKACSPCSEFISFIDTTPTTTILSFLYQLTLTSNIIFQQPLTGLFMVQLQISLQFFPDIPKVLSLSRNTFSFGLVSTSALYDN